MRSNVIHLPHGPARSGLLALCALWALLIGHALPASSWAADGEEGTPAPWIPNSALTLHLTPFETTGAHNPGANGNGILGEVLDSADYQSMLLVPTAWSEVYVLDLASGEAITYPRDAVVRADGRLQKPPTGTGQPTGYFATDADGRICLTNDACEIYVQAAAPLVGVITREELGTRFPTYARHTRLYRPDPERVARLATITRPVEILAFFGTWCQTCKHILPALLATVDAAGEAPLNVSLIALDPDMTEPQALIEEHGITTTPTFIILRNGSELARIEEEPAATIEGDLVRILLAADD